MKRLATIGLVVLAASSTSGCLAAAAVGVAGAVVGTTAKVAIKTTGAVVGAGVDIVTPGPAPKERFDER